MNSRALRATLTIGFGPKLALRALIVALIFASVTASAELEPETIKLVGKIGAEIPTGVLGSRVTEKYFRGLMGIGFEVSEQGKFLVRHWCEEFLSSMDPAGEVDRNGSFDYLRHEVARLFARDRLKGPRPATNEFNLASPSQRARILINILENIYDVPEHVGNVDQVPRVFDELLAIPYDKVEQSIAAGRYEQHWSGANIGPELNTSPFDAMAIQNELGPVKGKLVDVGSGYGVPGLIFSLFNPDLRYLGLELVPEKIAAAKELSRRFGVTTTKFRQTDLSKSGYSLPDADFYYMFNPVTQKITNALFLQLDAIAARKKISVILNSSWGDTSLFKNLVLTRTIRSFNGREIFVYESVP